MNTWLEIILSIIGAAIIFGWRYSRRNRRLEEQGIRCRRWLLHGSGDSDRLRRWRRSGRHTHDPVAPEIRSEDGKRAHVAQGTAGRPRRTWANPAQVGEPTHSAFELPRTALRTPMYRGRPARLWWLPEQEIPKALGEAARPTLAESVACTKCGGLNPVDSVFCGECRLFFEPPDGEAGAALEQVTGPGRKVAGARRNWQFGADRSVVEWRQGR